MHAPRTSRSVKRWPARPRAEVRLRLGRYVVLARLARLPARPTGPPGPAWGLRVVNERLGYGATGSSGRVEHWRPLPPIE